MSKQPPPAPTVSAVGPCPTVIQIVGRPGSGSLPSTIAPPDHPRLPRKSVVRLPDRLDMTLDVYCGCKTPTQHNTTTHVTKFHIQPTGPFGKKTYLKGLRHMIKRGWSAGAMVLGKLPVPGRPTIWIIVGQGPTVLAVGAGGCCLDIFSLVYHFSILNPSLWETARYRLKYCLKGPLSPNQPTNMIKMPAMPKSYPEPIDRRP